MVSELDLEESVAVVHRDDPDHSTSAREVVDKLFTFLGVLSVGALALAVATIAHADLIVVLEDGRVVGTGTHAELLETCPTYVEIVDSQLSAQEALA